MLDDNKNRLGIDAAAEAIAPTPLALRGARIVAALRRNRVALHRVGLAMSLVIVSISLFFFIRIVLTIDPRQLESAFAASPAMMAWRSGICASRRRIG
jgi:hypothetical protein